MKRLQIFTGGQPVRPDDFKMVQDESLTSLFEMIKGLCDSEQFAIISGLKLINTGGSNYSLSEGYIFDGIELCYCQGLNYINDPGMTLYLVLNENFDSNRQFKDLSYHRVIKDRTYTPVYQAAQPSNSFRFDEFSRISGLLSITPNVQDFRLTEVVACVLSPGYHGGGIYERVRVLKNDYGDILILAQFTTDTADGVVCVIPTTTLSVPTPVYGQYWNGSTWKRFTWHIDGRLEVIGAGTASAVNIIQFQCNINVSWPTV